MDVFAVPTATFRVLDVLVILRNDRRRVGHVNVTEHPTAEWTAQQVVEAFPWDEGPRFLMRDRDGISGAGFSSRVKGLGMEEVKSAPRSPWQNPHVERVIGSLRRELTDRVIVLGRCHLLRLLKRGPRLLQRKPDASQPRQGLAERQGRAGAGARRRGGVPAGRRPAP